MPSCCRQICVVACDRRKNVAGPLSRAGALDRRMGAFLPADKTGVIVDFDEDGDPRVRVGQRVCLVSYGFVEPLGRRWVECARGHPLKKFETPNDGFTCDKCDLGSLGLCFYQPEGDGKLFPVFCCPAIRFPGFTGSLVGAAPCGGALVVSLAQAAEHELFPWGWK
eukprot:gene12983-biopygen7320